MPAVKKQRWFYLLMIVCGVAGLPLAAAGEELSHAPLRSDPPPSQRRPGTGPARFVDAAAGDDLNLGSRAKPWKTVQHALGQLQAGDTLYLAGGVYYENLYVGLAGRADAPITIRSYPGEQAVIDGSLREFFEQPATAWEPSPEGAKDEYRSARAYPNLRDVLGSFGDSKIGLQTYYDAKDLRAENELVDWEDWDHTDQSDLKPIYLGPGMWYDRGTGRIHIRLAHTHNPAPVDNYTGPTDPRKVPLIITPFHAVALRLDGAEHLRLQDLVIRGGGYTTIELDHAAHIDFDNVTVWCGTYGMRASRTGPMRFYRSALHGNVAPWTYRADGSKRDYPGRPHRNLSRLNTHALIELDAGGESSVFATPFNDGWEMAYSEFTDAHDGVYLGAVNVRFHHNLIENLQDDGIYLSPMYYRHKLEKEDPQILIYQNEFRQLLTALAFGGPEGVTRDQVFIFRNLFDLRGNVNTGRPGVRRATAGLSTGKLMGDHGSPPWPAMNIYHNTVVAYDSARDATMASLGKQGTEYPRRVFNNVYCHLTRLAGYIGPNPALDCVADGNLFWSPAADEKQLSALFQRYRSGPMFAASKETYPPGSSSHSLAADPKFVKLSVDAAATNDYRLSSGSPAVNAGVPIPADWPDPLREADAGAPDIGAFPLGIKPWTVGRQGAPE